MMNAIIVDILDTGLETVLSLNEIAITLEDTSHNPGPDLDLAGDANAEQHWNLQEKIAFHLRYWHL